MSDIAPRLVAAMKDIYLDAVDAVGGMQKKQGHLTTTIETNRLTRTALECYHDNVTTDDVEKSKLLELIEKSRSMEKALNEASADLDGQIAEMSKGLAELEEDLRTIDPNFGKDLGPELPFPN